LITSANNGTELIIFDSGPLIQLHTQEAFSALALRVYREAGRIGACNLVLPEIAGATGAMLRDKRVNRAQRKQIQEFVRHNWDTWLILPLTATVCERAFELCQRHPLKGPDALHLAAAQALLRFRPQLQTVPSTALPKGKKFRWYRFPSDEPFRLAHHHYRENALRENHSSPRPDPRTTP